MGRILRKEPRTILSQNSSFYPRPTGSNSGFTLIEILITLSIIVLIMSVGIPAINRVTYQKVNSTSRKFVGIVRTIRNDAILLNTVHRLVIDVEHRSWWVETQKQFKLLTDSETEALRNKYKVGKGEPPPSNFVVAEKFSKKPNPLPDGVTFDGVLKEKEGLIKEGVAYINFFPSGYVDQSILYLNKEGATTDGYSIVIRPMAGRVDVANRPIKSFDVE